MIKKLLIAQIAMKFISGFFCRGSGCLELPVPRTARTAVNCEQFQTVI